MSEVFPQPAPYPYPVPPAVPGPPRQPEPPLPPAAAPENELVITPSQVSTGRREGDTMTVTVTP